MEYRRLRVAETLEESVRWEVVGFANEDDVKLEHLAPWIPLKTGGWVGRWDTLCWGMLIWDWDVVEVGMGLIWVGLCGCVIGPLIWEWVLC